MKSGILSFATLLLVSCGGGGGGSEPYIPGLYTIVATPTSNTCRFQAPALELHYRVDRNGTQIRVSNVSGSAVYLGNVTGKGSFQASRSEPRNCIPSGTSQAVYTIEFSDIDSTSAIVRLTETYGNCSGTANTACQIISEGGAEKASVDP